jgi:hypothetical protein
MSRLKKVDSRAHFEARKGSQTQAIDYCSKEDTRISGPFTYGEKSEEKQGKRNDLLEFINTAKTEGMKKARIADPSTYVRYRNSLRGALADFVLDDIDNATKEAPEVIMLYGPPGCGKTRLFVQSEKDGHMLGATDGFWFDGYSGEEAVLIDDYAGKASKWSLTQTLRILDRYATSVPVKGSTIGWAPKKIYLSTNIHPMKWFEYTGREAQYDALKRRFTTVQSWDSKGKMMTIPRDGLGWNSWWAGPHFDFEGKCTDAWDYWINPMTKLVPPVMEHTLDDVEDMPMFDEFRGYFERE